MNELPPANPFPPASGAMDAAWSALESALTRTTDALTGFETMVEKAEPDFRPVAERFRALHARRASELARLRSEANRVPDTDGLLIGAVNRAMVSTPAFFDNIDHGVLEQVVSGEASVIAAYRAVLVEPFPSPDRDVLTRLLAELQALAVEARHLA